MKNKSTSVTALKYCTCLLAQMDKILIKYIILDTRFLCQKCPFLCDHFNDIYIVVCSPSKPYVFLLGLNNWL